MKSSYHTQAQKFINSSKKLGYPVKAEGSELIAYPKGSGGKPMSQGSIKAGQMLGTIKPTTKMYKTKKGKKMMKKYKQIAGGDTMNAAPDTVQYKKRGKKKMKNWIAGAIKKPGALHREMGVKKGTKIPAGRLAAAAKKGGKLGQRARLAMTLKKLHKMKAAKPGDMMMAYKKMTGKPC